MALTRSLLVAASALLTCSVLLTPACRGEQPASRPAAPASPALGMNLAGPADWSTELPFVDVFRLSRPWISQRQGAGWGKGPELALDEHGWVKKLDEGCYAETPLCTIDGGHYPSGRYTVLYDGQGTLDFWNAALAVSREPGRIAIHVDSSKGALWVRLMKTDPNDCVRNIRVTMPGFEETYRNEPFYPVFLKRWKGVACFRFMDWMHTNGSSVRTWADRPTLQSATYSAKGVPVEVMVDLCNRQQTDAWFCLPHLCDDDYVRSFAKLVKDTLDPKLKVYLEYSNEVWNNMFPQTKYAQQKAAELGIGPKERPWEGGGKYYARRSVEIFRIWEEVFGGTDRLVRVLAWQAANPWWSDNILLPFEDAYRHADALAIAPYVTLCVPEQGAELTADKAAQWSLDQLFQHVETKALPDSLKWIADQKKIADKYGLALIAYEGGQHLVGVAGGENNDALTKLFHKANADPRMGALYTKYLDGWRDAGGGLFCNFSSVGKWSKWGSWGLLQFGDEDESKSPKFVAVRQWAKALGQSVAEPGDG
ncbi:MAG: hypothetical protein COZ06_04325 [Armatimonadetes bacterium CG_4_10_14_3_um_filter_66_18]|nr:hypothetical protein [Armatimonadota bacterium]PIU93194.1 MAG: hypothetical protein COS65_14020 [Armatimonadetes bacterium CG06_land_8_20_14_3_00_66_21]PIY51589.1 MAG: hypothetical protein COZ06_04325 [Armatimonadetes bacterium CG_4_10_14_3_um_filter_66_18]